MTMRSSTEPVESPATMTRSRFVHDGFVASAPWYDLFTRVFSFGLDARWRRACLERCELRPGQAVLDIATGTGELIIGARRALAATGNAVGLDFCGAMLEEGRRKVRPSNGGHVAWVQGRAETLPFRTAAFDCVTLGFALRHFEDLVAALREMVRVLRPGGRVVVVEWTRPDAAIPRALFLGYVRWLVPPLVRLMSGDSRVGERAAYLPRSIARFMPGAALGRHLEAAGLYVLDVRSYMCGLVSLCVTVKIRSESELARGADGRLGVEADTRREAVPAVGGA